MAEDGIGGLAYSGLQSPRTLALSLLSLLVLSFSSLWTAATCARVERRVTVFLSPGVKSTRTSPKLWLFHCGPVCLSVHDASLMLIRILSFKACCLPLA